MQIIFYIEQHMTPNKEWELDGFWHYSFRHRGPWELHPSVRHGFEMACLLKRIHQEICATLGRGKIYRNSPGFLVLFSTLKSLLLQFRAFLRRRETDGITIKTNYLTFLWLNFLSVKYGIKIVFISKYYCEDYISYMTVT